MVLRITTWNVNGIRNPFGYQPWRDRRTFDGMFDILEADIVIMQELKIQRKDLRDDMVLVSGWDCYFSLPKHKKGYSGVGIYTRQSKCAPIRAEEGVLGVLCPPNSSTPYCELPEDQHIGGYLSATQLAECGVDPIFLDSEGRCVVLEFPAFVLFGIYSPANSSGLRDDFRYGFLNALDMRVRNLIAAGKRVVVTGDLNVSRAEIDTANSEESMKKEGLTHEEYISTPNRRIFNQLLEGGEVVGERDEGREHPAMWDICRGFHPGRKGMFTHWEQKVNARPGNFGSRIDFILCSLDMKPWFCESNIQEGLMGSDHCPVYAVLKDEVETCGTSINLLDVMNAPGIFSNGKRLKEYSMKDIPALSGKLIQEFDKRRSIKDMFTSRPSAKAAPVTAVATPANTPPMDLSIASLIGTHPSPSLPVPALKEVVQPSTNDRKRSAPAAATSRTLKRTKSGSTVGGESSLKGQSSLKGFFKPKLPVVTGVAREASVEEVSEQSPTKQGMGIPRPATPPSTVDEVASVASFGESPFASQKSPSIPASPSQFVDPFVSRESWGKLFSKPMAPRCEGHAEPCKTMKTKKPGFNCGRDFWMCARPLGPTGHKERNTEWRCSTFIWSSDWNGVTDKNG